MKPGQSLQIATNFASKRKTVSSVAFYQGERVYGTDADLLSARKPELVYLTPQKLLGRNATHPAVHDYIYNSIQGAKVEKNERGGMDYFVPADSGFPEGDQHFSAEEMTAQLFSHLKEFTEDFGEIPVRDLVLVIPAYYTQSERLAITSAAELAGYNVMGLVDECAAAAVHYGVDKVEKDGTQYVLVFNMGAESTQLGLFGYDAYMKGGKHIGQVKTLAKAWDVKIGGRHLDVMITNWLADKVNADPKAQKVMPPEAKGDIRNLPRSMLRFTKSVVKAKEVLSANDSTMVFLEGILPNYDFKTTMSRDDLIEMGDKVGFWARIPALLDSLADEMKKNNVTITMADIQTVELVGGGVRVPRVQSLIREYFAAAVEERNGQISAEDPRAQIIPNIGTRMNGDEAMALGGAFIAANRSATFRVRPVGMIDLFPYGVGVRLTHTGDSSSVEQSDAIEVDDSAELSDGHVADTNPNALAKAWSKRSALFKPYHVYNAVKRIAFSTTQDVIANLFYETSSLLPEGTPKTIAQYSITGISDILKPESETAHLGAPKVHLSFELDHSGIVRLIKAEATQEETYEVTATSTPPPNGSESQDKAEGNNGEKKDTESATGENVESEVKQMKRTHRFPLTITPLPFAAIPEGKHLSVAPLSPEQFTAAFERLGVMHERDMLRRAVERARNDLETYIFTYRDKIDSSLSNYDDAPITVEHVSTEEQRTAIEEAFEAAEEWIWSSDEHSEEDYVNRLKELEKLVSPIFSRLKEALDREDNIATARKVLSEAKKVVEGWKTTHPQVSSS